MSLAGLTGHLIETKGLRRPEASGPISLVSLVTRSSNCSKPVWPATFVSDAVLKDSIRQLREALGDDAAAPNYIETAHRRGYRFIAQISAAAGEDAAEESRARAGRPAADSRQVDLSMPTSRSGALGRESGARQAA